MHRILIVRPSAIGDVVMASPMLKALKEGYPDARICWLVEPQVRELLECNRYVDVLIEWPKSRWSTLWRERRFFRLWSEVAAFRKTLRGERFDLVLDVQGLLRSRLLAWLSAGKTRVGFSSKEPGGFLMTRIISRGPDSACMSSEYRYMIESLGLDPGEFHPCLEISPEKERVAAHALEALGLDRDFAVFAPFTTRPQKHWFERCWVELAERIYQRFDLPVVILGGPSDQAAAEAMAAGTSGKVHSLAGRLRLAESMAVLKRCRLLIGVDTGLTHMGPAFDRPTVALFGATCPYRMTSRSNSLVLYHEFPCSPCRRSPTCDGQYSCMREISVDEVLTGCAGLLGNGRGGA